jgi:hypothetical protein
MKTCHVFVGEDGLPFSLPGRIPCSTCCAVFSADHSSFFREKTGAIINGANRNLVVEAEASAEWREVKVLSLSTTSYHTYTLHSTVNTAW